MTLATTLKFSELILKIGDGASPTEGFALICGIIAKSVTFSSNVVENKIPSCTESEAMTLYRNIDDQSMEVTASGVLDVTAAAFEKMRAWKASSAPKNIELIVDKPFGSNGGMWTGSFVMPTFKLDTKHADITNFDITLQSNGPVTWTPTPSS